VAEGEGCGVEVEVDVANTVAGSAAKRRPYCPFVHDAVRIRSYEILPNISLPIDVNPTLTFHHAGKSAE
jgi:hypothetical protein